MLIPNLTVETKFKTMKKIRIIGLLSIGFLMFAGTTACNKKKGHCYCKYANGEKKSFDFTHLDRGAQQDSCSQTSTNAGYFGGSCKLK